jgi:hypothetical protein
MDNFLIMNFNDQMELKVYKCGGCSYDNINYEIIDKSAFVSVESRFLKSWMEAYDWCLIQKVHN